MQKQNIKIYTKQRLKMLVTIDYGKLKELCEYSFNYGKNDGWESTFKTDIAEEIDKALTDSGNQTKHTLKTS